MSMLTSGERAKLKTSDFALPKDRAYPIHDEAHARDALSRVAQNGTPAERAKVRAAVKRRYPKIDVDGDGDGRGGVQPNSVKQRDGY